MLGRWLQLYMFGDPETAEAELAEELAGIYRDALPSAKGSHPSLTFTPYQCLCGQQSALLCLCMPSRILLKALSLILQILVNIYVCQLLARHRDQLS